MTISEDTNDRLF